MRPRLNVIKTISVILVLGGLFAFTNIRSEQKNIEKTNIQFLGKSSLFITREAVNKLLIQKTDSMTSVTKDALVLNELEVALNANEMIKSAEVYLTVNGQLGAKVHQRTPIVRVGGSHHYYVDAEGNSMPLSPYYSARVPLATGDVDKKDLESIYRISKYIYDDAFLKMHVISINKKKDQLELQLRGQDFIVLFGKVNSIEKKFNNLKAFYQKALKDKTLNTFNTVSLQFDSQVVCTKK